MRDDRSHEGTTNAEQAGSHKSADPLAPPTFVITAEQYNRMARVMEKKTPVRVRVSLKAQASDADVNSANIVGEIPGGQKKDEVVMIGGHFDSWHSGTGATDNGAGSGVMLEAIRLLNSLGLQPRRTIRIGLWTGEEQGLLGSAAYVRQHYGAADSTGFHAMPEQAKFAAYFNVDNGSGKIRGVYLQGIEAERPIFDAWMGPFKADGMKTITVNNTGGTDHLSYIGVGLPGFQFI